MNELDLIILKHILTSKKNALDFIAEADEKIFDPNLWRFAKLILDYIKTFREIPTQKVINERNRKNETLLKYINQVWDSVNNAAADEREYKHDLEKIKNRFAEKLIYTLKDRLVGDDGRIDLKKSVAELNSTQQQIKGLNSTKIYEQKSLKESINDFKNRYVAKMHNPKLGAGIKTGYSFLDFTLAGLKPQEMLVIGAESGCGKSILMMNMGINQYLGENTISTERDFKSGCDILFFSLEMPWNDMQERVLACLAKVKQTSIRDATLTQEETDRLAKTLKFIENYPHDFTIVDMPRGATVSGLELIYNEICQTKRKPQVVIVDYLALLSHDERSDEADWIKMNYISEALHEFARVNDIALITASQLNRPSQNKGAEQNGKHRGGCPEKTTGRRARLPRLHGAKPRAGAD